MAKHRFVVVFGFVFVIVEWFCVVLFFSFFFFSFFFEEVIKKSRSTKSHVLAVSRSRLQRTVHTEEKQQKRCCLLFYFFFSLKSLREKKRSFISKEKK